MKFIKNHLTFIFPLMAILIGIEFFLVFERTTISYEDGLRDKYSMHVVVHDEIELESIQNLNSHIFSIDLINDCISL